MVLLLGLSLNNKHMILKNHLDKIFSQIFQPLDGLNGVVSAKDVTACNQDIGACLGQLGSGDVVHAAVNLNLFNTNVLWKASLDSAEFAQGGGYSVSGEDGWGTWRDGTGAFWHGRKLNVTLTGMRQSNATLWVRFRDPNGKNRSGRGVCEGRSFTIPKHQKAKDGIYWAKLPIIREDALDGKIEFSCEALTGPNLMIDRVVLVEEK